MLGKYPQQQERTGQSWSVTSLDAELLGEDQTFPLSRACLPALPAPSTVGLCLSCSTRILLIPLSLGVSDSVPNDPVEPFSGKPDAHSCV